MGARYARDALENWAHLPSNPRFVLLMMALTVLDRDPNPRWWGGDDLLLRALGRSSPADDDPSVAAEKARHANDVAVRRCVSELVKAGALSYAVRPVKGRRPEYWMHLVPQADPAASDRESCGIRRPVLHIPQAEPAPKENGGVPKITYEDRSPETLASPARILAPVEAELPPVDEAARQHAALREWELGQAG